jgi:hypothetical protein
VANSAPELANLAKNLPTITSLMHLKRRGWSYVTDRRVIELGKLQILHGHEYPTPIIGPVNPARGAFLRAMECVMVGHHHQTSEHTAPTLSQKMITTWSTGCLCDLHPAYARLNKWNQGFAAVEVDSKGRFNVDNLRVLNGRVLA